MEEEYTVCLLSDGSLVYYPDNQPSKFTNLIQSNLLRPNVRQSLSADSPRQSYWECCLTELAFQADYMTTLSPQHPRAFTLCLASYKCDSEFEVENSPYLRADRPEDIWEAFESQQPYYLPDKTMHLAELAYDITAKTDLWSYYSYSDKQFTINKIEDDEGTYREQVLWIHETFFAYFNGPFKEADLHAWVIKKILPDEQVYYVFPLTIWRKPLFTRLRQFRSRVDIPTIITYRTPSIIKVQCPEVESQPHQSPVLGLVPLSYNNRGFQHICFKHKQFFPLRDAEPKQISIHLRELSGNSFVPLKKRETPTLVKIVLRRRYLPENKFVNMPVTRDIVVHAISTFDNVMEPPSSLRMRLTQNIPMTNINYSVALTSLSFPISVTLPLTTEELTVTITVPKARYEEPTNYVTFTTVFPSFIHDVETLIHFCNENCGGYLRGAVTESGQFQLVNTVHHTIPKGERGIKFEMSFPLFEFLNGRPLLPTSNTTTAKKTFEFSTTHTFDRRLDASRFFPKLMYIESDLVKPSLVGGQQRQLLKIVPLDTQRFYLGQYHTIDFQHLDFYPIALTEVRDIRINLCDQSGNHYPFPKNTDESQENIVLTLLFSPTIAQSTMPMLSLQ